MMLSTSAVAAINKWVDKEGRIHYSDSTPPTDVKKETLHSSSATSVADSESQVPAASAREIIAEREAGFRRAEKAKQEAAELEAQQKTVAKLKQENCEISKRNVRGLQDGMRIMEVDAGGVRSFISDEERQSRLVKSQKDIDTYCK